MKNHSKNKVSEVLKSTCAAAAVATCWGVGQQAEAGISIADIIEDNFLLEVSSSTNITDLVLIYGNAASGSISTNDLFFESLPDITTGSLSQTVFLNGSFFIDGLLQASPDELVYTIIGNYSDPTNPDIDEQSGVGIGIGFFEGIIGDEFSDVFPTFAETDIIDALATDNFETLGDFFVEAHDNNLVIFNDDQDSGALINFSQANNVGTVSLSPVPEPGSVALLIAGGLLTASRRKRS